MKITGDSDVKMANKAIWNKLRYLKPNEKWGDTNAISDDLLLLLDDFRHYIGCPIIVTEGVATDGHKSKSFHYPENGACAVDLVIPDYQNSPIDLIFDALRFPFNGIGYYPHWKYNDKVCGGLHLDTRPMLLNKRAMWLGIPKDKAGSLAYVPLTMEHLHPFLFNQNKENENAKLA
jgi:hypothetical protein